MRNDNFWNDVVKYGAILGAVAIVFDVLGAVRQNMLLSIGSLAAFIVLVFYFTKRRATLYGNDEQGYSYGRCMGFIVCMMLVAGLLQGIYTVVASKWLFVEKYQEATSLMVASLESTGFYTAEMLEKVVKITQNPAVTVFSSILGAVIKGAFFGLFIAAFTRREPNIFAEPKDE